MRKLLFCLLVLMLPISAFAAITTETISESGGKLATNRYTFADEVPQVVMQQLGMHGYENVRCISGLALERLVLEYPEGQENAYRSSDALLLLETADGHSLVGMRWQHADEPGWLAEYGALGVDWQKGFQLSFAPAELHTVDFALTGECEGRLRTWRLNVTGQNVWYVKSCETPGGETVGWSEFDGAFQLDDGLHYACWWPQLDVIQTLNNFPSTQQAAAALAQSSWAGVEMEQLVMIGGNLREKPTGKSRSLGYSQGRVIAEMLGQQPGLYEPWYQVRVGHTVGWVSGSLVTPLSGEVFAGGLLRPLKLATVKEEIPLRLSPQEPKTVQMLPAGTEVQVLFWDADGWLHVVLPTARALRFMDMNGTYGYVRLEEVDVTGLTQP